MQVATNWIIEVCLRVNGYPDMCAENSNPLTSGSVKNDSNDSSWSTGESFLSVLMEIIIISSTALAKLSLGPVEFRSKN